MTRFSLFDVLPEAFVQEAFAQDFVGLFDALAGESVERVAGAARTFDLAVAPPSVLRMLAGWINVSVPESWSDDEVRDFVRVAFTLQRWRGTRRGVEDILRWRLGCDVVVHDPTAVTYETDSVRPSEPVRIVLPHACSASARDVEALVATVMPVGVCVQLEWEPEPGLDSHDPHG